MKTKTLSLWILLGFLLGACGGDGDENGAVCGNGIVEAGEECDDDTEACSNCKIAAGWECPDDGECFEVEICDNGIDDTGNGLVDCADPYCDTHPNCSTGCSSQAACSSESRQIVEICAEGLCRMATSFDDNGQPQVGEVGVANHFGNIRTNSIKSFSMEYFHPAVPGSSEPLSCEALAGQVRSGTLDTSTLNRVRFGARQFTNPGRENYTLRDSGVLVTSDQPWLKLTRFYEGNISSEAERVTGRLLAFSCVDSLSVYPGNWDDSRLVSVDVMPVCERDEHCADGWTCMRTLGLCAYRQCEPACTSTFACRELEGEPTCLPKCHENNPCDAGNRCDETPGWEPACFPF